MDSVEDVAASRLRRWQCGRSAAFSRPRVAGAVKMLGAAEKGRAAARNGRQELCVELELQLFGAEAGAVTRIRPLRAGEIVTRAASSFDIATRPGPAPVGGS